MGFVANVTVDHPNLPLAGTIETHPDATIRYEYGTVADGERYGFVSVFGDERGAVEDAMAVDHTVSKPTRVAAFENRAIYRISIETDLEIVPDRCAECGLFVFGITSTDRGWTVRIHLPDRDALAVFREYCRARDVTFRVNELYDSTASDERTYFLTDRQYEVLSTAYYAGYYDVPRSASQADLAARLDVSTSAVSQRLRRAVAELIAATIENDRTPPD